MQLFDPLVDSQGAFEFSHRALVAEPCATDLHEAHFRTHRTNLEFQTFNK